MEKEMTFKDLYCFAGFRANGRLTPHPEHAGAWIVALRRRQKKQFARAVIRTVAGTIREPALSVTLIAVVRRCTLKLPFAVLTAAGATR